MKADCIKKLLLLINDFNSNPKFKREKINLKMEVAKQSEE